MVTVKNEVEILGRDPVKKKPWKGNISHKWHFDLFFSLDIRRIVPVFLSMYFPTQNIDLVSVGLYISNLTPPPPPPPPRTCSQSRLPADGQILWLSYLHSPSPFPNPHVGIYQRGEQRKGWGEGKWNWYLNEERKITTASWFCCLEWKNVHIFMFLFLAGKSVFATPLLMSPFSVFWGMSEFELRVLP